MENYRCYLVSYDGHIHDVAELTADGDAGAIDQARALLAAAAFPGFELWLEARLVWEEYWPPNGVGSDGPDEEEPIRRARSA